MHMKPRFVVIPTDLPGGPTANRNFWLIALRSICASLFVFTGASAQAADSDTEALKRQVEALSERVKALESRIGTVETQHVTPSAAGATGAMNAASVNDAWEKIKQGLTKDDVKKILGEPEQQFTLGGRLLWYYRYPGIGAGSVMFGNDGLVIANQEPPRRY